MNRNIVRLLAFVSALMLAAFALPGFAATKQFTFALSPSSAAAGSAQMTATFYDLATGNSNINSLSVTAPAGFQITGATSTLGTPTWTATTASLTNMTGITPGNQGSLTLTVTVPNSPGCSQNLWTATAYTGSAFGGTQFTNQPTSNLYQPYTNITSGCTLSFTAQPANAQASAQITSVPSNPTGTPLVTVSLLNGNTPVPWFNGTVSLAISQGTPGAVLSNGSATASSGTATFPGLSINLATGSNPQYVLTANAGGSIGNSNPFTIFQNGNIGCVGGNTGYNNYNSLLGTTDFTYDPDHNNTPPGSGWGLRRGANKDGANCVLVDYTFTPPAPGNNVASLFYDQSTGQKASWKYLIAWNAIPVDSSGSTQGWTTFRPLVSWGIPNPNTSAGSTDFVPALFCANDPGDLSQRTVAELAALLPTMPNDCATSGPFCAAATAHPAVYPLGGKAKVCVSQQGFSSGPNNTIFPWTEIVDEEDTVVLGR